MNTLASYETYFADNYLCLSNLPLLPEDAADAALVDPLSLQEWATVRMKQCTSLPCVRALATLRNSAAPIHRMLPPEILMEVFYLTRPGQYPRDRWYNVLHVCRLWRALVLRTPAFWADELSAVRNLHEETDEQIARLNLFMDLARTQPLGLSLCSLRPSLASVLSSHTHHLVYLQIKISSSEETMALNAMLAAGAAVLDTLSIKHEDFSCEAEVEDLLIRLDGSRVPSLEVLDAPWPFVAFTGTFHRCSAFAMLECKCIQCPFLYISHHSRPESFQSALRALPNLKTLWIAVSESPMHSFRWDASISTFPALRTLYVEAAQANVQCLLTHLPFHAACVIDVFSGNGAFRGSLPHELASFYPVSNADRVDFVLIPETQELAVTTYSKDTKMLCLKSRTSLYKFNAESFVACFSDLTEMFAPARNVTTLSLRLSRRVTWGSEQAASVQRLLAGLPQLLQLDVAGDVTTHDMFWLLGAPLPSGGFLCPSLKALTIEWTCYPRGYGRLEGPPSLEKVTAFAEAIAVVVERRVSHATAPLKTLCVAIIPYLVRCRWDEVDIAWGEFSAVLHGILRPPLERLAGEVTVKGLCGLKRDPKWGLYGYQGEYYAGRGTSSRVQF